MNKLKFTKDEGSEFYKELNEKIEQYFADKGFHKTGNKIMIFKINNFFISTHVDNIRFPYIPFGRNGPIK